MSTTPSNPRPVSFRDALKVWTKVGLESFGGPAGQIAVMHRVYVDEKRWIREDHFLHALNYCMVLPGPEATQLSVYVGWLMFGTRGGLFAGLLFVLPGALAMLWLSALYAAAKHLAWVDAAFFGIKAAVLAIVVEAVLRIGKRALKGADHVVLAALAFAGIALLRIPFPWIVLAAGAIGYARGRRAGHAATAVRAPAAEAVPTPTLARTLRVLATGLALWLVPVAAIGAALGWDSAFFQQGLLASRAAVVTFGGAYAVLAYVAQQAVDVYGWLAPAEMLDGLGLAETTPGPLILVLEFVGYVGAYRNPGALEPALAGCLGAAVTLWATFVPCFLWIFLGAPYVETLREHRGWKSALEGVTAAVVGVILNLAVWLALHVLFARVDEIHLGPLRIWSPDASTWNPAATAIALLAAVLVLRLRASVPWTIVACASLGMLVRFLET